MNLSDLHEKLSRKKSYRDAYAKIGDAVKVAFQFRAAREAARLTRTELSKLLGLRTQDVAAIEDEFDFADTRAVSLIADRLEGHLKDLGIDCARFIQPGATMSDLPHQKEKPLRKIHWKQSDFEESPQTGRRDRLSGAIPANQLTVLRRLSEGATSGREAVQDLVRLGVQQPRAESMVADVLEQK
jgi:DNA-binding XRE family transcriptional regulator